MTNIEAKPLKELLKFLEKYKSIICFTLVKSIQNENLSLYSIYKDMEESFFTKNSGLYFSRKYNEEIILSKIEDNLHVLSIEGCAGCGKSTLILKDLCEIKNHNLIVDFNSENAKTKLLLCKDISSWIASILEQLKDEVWTRYFENYIERQKDLLELILFSEDEKIRVEFGKIRRKIQTLWEKSGEINISEIDWYKKNKDNIELIDIRNEFTEKTRISHLIIALKAILKLEGKFIIVFDNVDLILKEHQPFCYTAATILNGELRQYAKIIICIRHENANLVHNIPAHDYEIVDSLKLVDLAPEQSEENYLDNTGFNYILDRRQNYFKSKYPNEQFSKNLFELSELFHKVYSENYLIDLANQSIRVALDFHCKFMSYILTNKYEKYINESTNVQKYTIMNSLFIGWIADELDFFTIKDLNIINVLKDSESKSFDGIGCDLSYLILAFLYNHTARHGINERVSVRFRILLDELMKIGFNPTDIRRSIYRLYSYMNKDNDFISIFHDDQIKDENSLEDDTAISISFRGRCLIKNIMVSFTYLAKLLIDKERYNIDDDVIKDFYSLKSHKECLRYIIRLFSRIAYLHTIQLHNFCKKINHKDWLKIYRNNFCIDNKLHLVRMIEKITYLFKEEFVNSFQKEDKETVESYLLYLTKLNEIYIAQIEGLSRSTENIFDYKHFINDAIRGEFSNYKSLDKINILTSRYLTRLTNN